MKRAPGYSHLQHHSKGIVSRLPFGIHSASEIFQVEIANLIAGIQGTANLQHDIIVWVNSKLEHDNRLEQVLKRISSTGLKLNREKCRFGEKEIVFLNHVGSFHVNSPDKK